MSPKKVTEVSGWYSKQQLTAAERAEEQRRVEEWYAKKIDLNYRPIALDAPGLAVLALGKIALEKGIPFGQFVEGILLDYLDQQGVNWRG